MENLKLLKKELIAANKGAATNFKVSQILLTENTKLKAELLTLQDHYNAQEKKFKESLELLEQSRSMLQRLYNERQLKAKEA